MMADYAQAAADLRVAAAICEKHTITTPVNGVQPSYPRWPEAWVACEVVWRSYLEMQTMTSDQDWADRDTVNAESRRLLCKNRKECASR